MAFRCFGCSVCWLGTRAGRSGLSWRCRPVTVRRNASLVDPCQTACGFGFDKYSLYQFSRGGLVRERGSGTRLRHSLLAFSWISASRVAVVGSPLRRLFWRLWYAFERYLLLMLTAAAFGIRQAVRGALFKVVPLIHTLKIGTLTQVKPMLLGGELGLTKCAAGLSRASGWQSLEAHTSRQQSR